MYRLGVSESGYSCELGFTFIMSAFKTLRSTKRFQTARFLSSKVFPSAAAAVADIKSGSKLLCGGFGLCGIPEFLITAVRDAGPT
jgi:hypothetical protein